MDAQDVTEPIRMRLPCPACGTLHIDQGEFATRPHRIHACQTCGMIWQPATTATIGVRYLEGMRDDGTADDGDDVSAEALIHIARKLHDLETAVDYCQAELVKHKNQIIVLEERLANALNRVGSLETYNRRLRDSLGNR